MCGIAGIAAQNSKKYESHLSRMTSALVHRGPDGEGLHFFGECGLGHRRLAIIDLKTGDQPMLSQSAKSKSQIAVVFNGEIYGYKDIKKSLRSYPFRTSSDTEVILALYDKYGDRFLKHLPGMFAFALWDDRKKKLICARDRFGEKPLYYAFGKNNTFLFASEIKALLASELVRPKLDKGSLVHYLKHLYIHPHFTIYENIHTLPPAHFLTYEKGRLKIERYWQMPELNEKLTLEDALPEFKRLLEEAVKKQLVADVPVGAFLSGGFDSSTIVALASRHKKKLKTFSFGFEDSISELPYAREVAEKYDTDHTELFDNENLGELLLRMQTVYDEPFADSSNIPTYLISKLSRQYTTVALTGDGGDELLAGYGWYKPFLYEGKSSFGSVFLRHQFVYLIAKLLSKISDSKRYRLLHRVLGANYKMKYSSIFEAHLEQNVVMSDEEVKKLGLREKEKRLISPGFKPSGTLDDALRLDLENYMPGDILVKIDRASMANSLELRAPFLDVPFAEFCIGLPYQLKITKETDKHILHRAFEELWPREIRSRGKRGFGAPVEKWLNQDKSLRALKASYLSGKNLKIFEILPKDFAVELGRKNNYKTWTLLVLSLWLENHQFDL